MTRLLILAVAFSAAAVADEAWVELGPSGAIARYASRQSKTCPSISLDGKSQAMTRRKAAGSFTALVCETAIPESVQTASIRNEKLPVPHFAKDAKPNILVIGDTGCRIKQGSDDSASTSSSKAWNIQRCDDPSAWPFREVANRGAAAKPDLVIHVGDYLYREKNCMGVKHCPGGPAGDALDTWEADFFTPAKTLLRAAPWVFVRGNHEDCNRAGNGWFTLLDPRPFARCEEFTDPYVAHAGALPLVVLDNSTASDAPCESGNAKCATQFAREVETYAGYFGKISGSNLAGAWMLMHRPVWAIKRGGEGIDVLNAALEAAWAKQAPAGIDLLLAGHTHVFEAITFGPESHHPMQIVAGNGGTKLAAAMKFDAANPQVQAAGIRDVQKIQDFGYTTIRPAGAGWAIEAHDHTGEVRVHCAAPPENSGAGASACSAR